MSGLTLRLVEDRLTPAARPLRLPALNRVLYVVDGGITVARDGVESVVAAGSAWQGASACVVTPGGSGARVLRYELAGAAVTDTGAASGVETRERLAAPIALDPAADYLMRCDRVDFDPGGEARPHGHRGGGIRCLLAGALEVRIGGHPGRVMRPGDAWFESGVEPVHALASREAPTSFIRVSILPREIRGTSSIVYVDPRDAAIKPRTYTVLVDEPIEPPEAPR